MKDPASNATGPGAKPFNLEKELQTLRASGLSKQMRRAIDQHNDNTSVNSNIKKRQRQQINPSAVSSNSSITGNNTSGGGSKVGPSGGGGGLPPIPDGVNALGHFTLFLFENALGHFTLP